MPIVYNIWHQNVEYNWFTFNIVIINIIWTNVYLMNPVWSLIFSPGVKIIGGFEEGFRTACLVFFDAKLMEMFMIVAAGIFESNVKSKRL